jgi:hypothetical protein
MLTEDYIMRMINQAIYVLRKILGLKGAGKYQEALLEIDLMLEALLGLKSSLVKRLDDESILNSLTQQEKLDTDRLYVVAELIREEGEILAEMQREEESALSFLRALHFYLEVVLSGGAPTFNLPHEHIKDLFQRLHAYQLPSDTLYLLFCYYEDTGRYARASSVLEKMGNDPKTQAEVIQEQIEYFERLLEKTDEVLLSGGVTRADIEKRLEELQGEQ